MGFYNLYLEKLAALYHGSPIKFDTLRAGSWVTPYKQDARSFAVPWDSRELLNSKSIDGRPPKKLKFKSTAKIPEDQPIFLYKIKRHGIPAETNTGKHYSWNRQITEDSPATLIEQHPSWKKYFKVK